MLDNIDTKLLRQYVLYLLKKTRCENHPHTPAKTEPLSVATLHGHVRTLRAFFKWLLAGGLTQNNPANDLRPPKVSRKVVSTLSDEEIKSTIGTFNPTSPSDARNQTLFMILLDTGLRIGEVINLKMGNVQKVLQRYLFRHRPTPIHHDIDNVFLAVNGIPLTENSTKLMFVRLAQRLGVH